MSNEIMELEGVRVGDLVEVLEDHNFWHKGEKLRVKLILTPSATRRIVLEDGRGSYHRPYYYPSELRVVSRSGEVLFEVL